MYNNSGLLSLGINQTQEQQKQERAHAKNLPRSRCLNSPGYCLNSPKNSSLDISTFYSAFNFDYSQHRRFIRSINRLNYLQYIGFDFGRSTAITLTISNDYINNKVAIRNARDRFQRFLRRRGIRYYVVAKELGALNDRLHYHVVVFNCPFLDMQQVDKIWRIGQDIKFQEIKNIRGAIYYIVSYLKKGINLQFSRAFFKERLLSNDVFYTVQYDKKTGLLSPHGVYGAYITKKDYNIFKGRIPSPTFNNYAFAWRIFNNPQFFNRYNVGFYSWALKYLSERLL